MPIIDTLVSKSNDTKHAALNLNAKTFQLRRTLAAVWDLDPSTADLPSQESTLSLDSANEPSDTSFASSDGRVKVQPHDLAPEGRYRSIVKLFISHEFQKSGAWSMGTGWLIRPDILVTAGHCAYDWKRQLGRATEVQCYVGYDGRQSVKSPNVQFRSVKRVVTTEGWIKAKGQRSFDVSFMQVDRPFTGIRPVEFDSTPDKANTTIGVVGFPSDLTDGDSGERGAHMYEMFLPTRWDLAAQANTMLEYQIDTFGGSCGSPVLQQSDLIAIGTHVYGGDSSCASVIGKYGNPYNDYLTAFTLPPSSDGLNLVPVTDAPATLASAPEEPTAAGSARKLSDSLMHSSLRRSSAGGPDHPERSAVKSEVDIEEDFLDALKQAASIGVPMTESFNKSAPIGAPVSALVGFALGAAGKLASRRAGRRSNSPQSVQSLVQADIMGRAILADATLTSLQNMELDQNMEESLFIDMKSLVMKSLPTVRQVTPHIMTAVTEPALRISLDLLRQQRKGNAKDLFTPDCLSPSIACDTYTLSRQADTFRHRLWKALKHSLETTHMSEDSKDDFSDLITAGIGARNNVLNATSAGLPTIAKAVGGAKSAPPEALAAQQVLPVESLATRAVVAEAALQAVMKLPPSQLEEEGFFDTVAGAVRKLAPGVRLAKEVAWKVNDLVGRILGDAQAHA